MNKISLSVVMVFALATALSACAAAPTTPAAERSDAVSAEQAQAAYGAEDWAETARLYGALVKQTPSNARYWYRLAVAQRYLGDLDKALASLDKGTTNGLPVSYADYERAKVAATRGDAADAIGFLQSAAAAGLSGKDRVMDNEQLAALKGTEGFDQVVDVLDANANPCRDNSFRQFDFWIGTWEVKTASGAVAGRNAISTRESGCLLLEEWTGTTGTTGTSMNYYDAITDRWTQVWVSPGLQLRITGGMQDGSMVLTGNVHYIQQGNTAPFRGTWTPLDDGRVRQFFEQQDGEGNWNPWFEGFYSKLPESPGTE